MKRVFIAIDIPKEVCEEIARIQGVLPIFKGKKIMAENLHLTLKFLGSISEEKINIVKDRLSKIYFERFEADINSIGVFSENFVRVIWLDVNGCEKLQKEVDACLFDLFEKEKRFMGHLTIARAKEMENSKNFVEELKKIIFLPLKFEVNCFKLKESILIKPKPIYQTLMNYTLK